MNHLETGAGRLSLAQRLTQGKILVGDALRWAGLLAESLRKAHDAGRVHGWLTPSLVWLDGRAVEVVAAAAGPRTPTPYTAPELVSGKRADARADIFSFGAILYEMLTGRSHAQSGAQPSPTGSRAADSLLAGCLAKDPAARWQHIQKVILELKLLRLIARKAQARAAGRRRAEGTVPAFGPPADGANPAPESAAQLPVTTPPYLPAIRAEMQQSASRLAARLQLGEKALAVLNRAVIGALTGLRGQISTLTSQVAAIEERSRFPQPDGEAPISSGALARIELTMQAFVTRMEVIEKGLGVLHDRVGRTEQDGEAIRQRLQKQEKAGDSARTAMAQTDGLVERLAEALEALQATVLQRSGEWPPAANVN